MDLGVYIHFPFCGSRCGYCDFYSTVGQVPHRDYADAVLRELKERLAEGEGCRLTSVFVGGGTPSLWHPDELGRVLASVAALWGSMPEDLELSVELNPGTLDRRGLERLVRAGVNRLSVGVQSLDNAALALLGRRHTVEAAVRALREARQVGVANLSCDVILGIPGQSADRYLELLEQLLEESPDHVSTYALTLSPRSALARRGVREVESDLAAEMMERGRAVLRDAGYAQYEVSNYARPGHRCRHNQGVWAGLPYIGLGAGAHSMRWRGGRNLRRVNPGLDAYLGGAPGAVEQVEEPAARFEMLFLGLRTVAGLDRGRYRSRFGIDPVDELGGRLTPLVSAGLLAITEGAVCPTEQGIWFADELALRLAG